MPLIKREIQPAYVSRVKLQKGLVNEFESVSVSTLSGIIRQISSLAKYSDDVFNEIINEADGLHKRATSLQIRISGLSQKVTQLDSSVEEISLQDINIKKAFKSTIVTDQQVVGRVTLPKSMRERYTACEAPPRLQDMNEYRDDAKDALKFYTDPTYFFELWREEMKKEQDRKKKKKRRDRKPGRTQSQVTVKHIKKKVYTGKDKELDVSNAKYSIQDNPAAPTNTGNAIHEQNGPVSTPNSLSPDEPTSYDGRRDTSVSRRGTAAKLPRPIVKPPPPPPVPSQISNIPSPQPPPNFPPPGSPMNIPPPPPALPDPGILAPPPPPLPMVQPNHSMPATSDHEPMPPEPKPVDTRTDLLDAIKQGMKLRKVQVESEKKQQQNVGMDVASILQRRIAVEYSDTESETGSEWDDEEEDWDDGDD